MKKTIKGYGGFVDNKLDLGWWTANGNLEHILAIYSIFRTRREAREYFEDVRPVTITIEETKKG